MEQITNKAGLQIEMNNISIEEMAILRNHITKLIEWQIHKMKDGKMILHFDSKGVLRKGFVQKEMWTKPKKEL